MTSVEAGRRTERPQGMSGTSPGTPETLSSRLGRGGPLIIGAVLVLLLLKPIGPLPIKGWVPILIGLAYIASGLLSGRRGLLLGPGIVLAAWGVAPMSTNYGGDFPGMFYLTLGTGLLIAAVLAQRGWHRITPMSLALPVLFIGGTMFVASLVGTWLTTILAVLMVGWGLWEMLPQASREHAASDPYAS